MPKEETIQQDEEQEELVDLWDGVEYEEGMPSPTDDELEEEEIEEEEESEEEEDEETSEEEESDIDPDLELEEDEDKEEEDEEDEDVDPDDVPLVESIRKSIGFEFEDQEFEDTEEGIQRLVEESAKKLADQQIDNIFSEYPEVQELYEYRRMGGDPDQFLQTKFPEVDFQKVEFDEEDEQQHEMLVRRELAERGYSGDELEAELEDIKNGGILESKAKRALSTLQAKQEEQQEQLLQQQREKHQQQQQKIKEFWDDVEQTIQESTTFKNLKIPAKDKDDFFEYLSRPVENGMSQRDLDVQEADLETRLAIDYLIYKGFNISDLIDRKAKDKSAKTLREKMNKRKLEKKRQQESQTTSDPNVELGSI